MKKEKAKQRRRAISSTVLISVIVVIVVVGVSAFVVLRNPFNLLPSQNPSSSSSSSSSSYTFNFGVSKSALKLNNVSGSYSAGSEPNGVIYDSTNNMEYVADTGSNSVSVYNGSKLVATVGVGSSPVGLAYDDPGNFANNALVLVTNSGSNSVSVINDTSNTVFATISVGMDPTGIVADTSLDISYVANSGSNTLSVINDSSLTVMGSPIQVGNGPIGLAWDGGTEGSEGYVFVANNKGNEISVIDESTSGVISEIPNINSPYGIVYDNNNQELYVTSNGTASNTVNVINTTNSQFLKTITVGNDPRGICEVSVTYGLRVFDLLYVANFGANSVTVINASTNTINTTITGVNKPIGVSFNQAVGLIYVTNYDSSAITTIALPPTSPPTPGLER
jgi:YVTN family beta-propeller protein